MPQSVKSLQAGAKEGFWTWRKAVARTPRCRTYCVFPQVGWYECGSNLRAYNGSSNFSLVVRSIECPPPAVSFE